MPEKYISLISGLIGALIGAGVSLLTIRSQLGHWMTQQHWSNREKHYTNLLSNLTQLKLSLLDRSEYFLQPGSEHDSSISDDPHFKTLSTAGSEALQAIREQLGAAAVFLSDDATHALNAMISGLWHTAQDAMCTADYVDSALGLVDAAYSKVLTQARSELAKV